MPFWRHWGRWQVAAFVYLVAAVVITWPVAAQLGRAFPGRPGDQTYEAWCIDHFWWRLLHGESPFTTDRILYPIGANLLHSGTAPIAALPALPFYLTETLVLYFGVLVLATITMGALGMRAFVRSLGADDVSALVAGFLYAASPSVLSLPAWSHQFLGVAASLLPWALVAFLRLLHAPGARYLVIFTCSAWGLFFADYSIWLMFLVFIGTTSLACIFARRHVAAIVAAALLNGAVAIVLISVLPPLDPSDLISGAGTWHVASMNLADLFVPASTNPVLGSLGRFATDRPNGDVECYYLGLAPLFLALLGFGWGIRRCRTIALGLSGGGLLLAFLACGPVVRFMSHELATGSQTAWHWLMAVPPLQSLGMPRRFVLGLQFAVAALAALGLTRLRAVPGRRLSTVSAIGLVAIEYATLGMHTYTVPVPKVVYRLANLPDDRTLLEVPSGVTESKRIYGYDYTSPSNSWQMYYQTIHHRRRVGAYLSRIPHSTYRAFAQMPVLGDLFVLTSPEDAGEGHWRSAFTIGEQPRSLARLPDYPPEIVASFVRTVDLGYVLVQPGRRHAIFRESIERVLKGWIDRTEEIDGFVLFFIKESVDRR